MVTDAQIKEAKRVAALNRVEDMLRRAEDDLLKDWQRRLARKVRGF